MSCHTVETPVVAVERPAVPVAPVKSSWYSDDADEDDDDDDNDWGVGADDGAQNMANLEEAMTAMEKNLKNGALPKQSKKSAPSKEAPSNSDSGPSDKASFPCYLLTKQIEPPALNQVVEEDDVGLSASDDKIRNMLARYMAEEEDEAILASLKGTDLGGDIAEEDERLNEDERLLLGFQDRLRRVPRQVVRYAKGGMPLWSIPSSKKGKVLWNYPTCASCGTKCVFEMQLLPSLLHILQVDQFAMSGTTSEGEGVKINDLLSNGVNWGSVAVFTCPNPACDSASGALVIQESVDEKPGVDPGDRDFTPTMAVVEDMEDDADFEPYQN